MTLLVILAATGCVRDLPRGPDLGPCAEPPDRGGYTYANIGIGTCLAAPNALDVLEKDGKRWLVVANPDSYLSFSSGSLLLVDIDSIDFGRERNLVSDLAAHALSTDPFNGGLGIVPGGDRLLLPSRWSPDSATRVEQDEVFVVDISDPTTPAFADQPAFVVEDDPEPIVVDPVTGLAFVVNLTSHGITVIDTAPDPMVLVDASPDASLTPTGFSDRQVGDFAEPLGGSTAEISLATVDDAARVPTESWTLTWVDAGYRLWVPDLDGFVPWTSGGDTWRPPAGEMRITTSDAGEFQIIDPFVGSFESSPLLWYGNRGVLRAAPWSTGDLGFDFTRSFDALEGKPATWAAHLGAPIAVDLDSNVTLFFEGRPQAGSAPQIGRAVGDASLVFNRSSEPVITPPDGWKGVGDPWVRADVFAGALRMWLSMQTDDGAWQIGIAESPDQGASWSVPAPVEGLPDGLAAPIVDWRNGRYLLWASAEAADGGTEVWTAWSWDGLAWRDAAPVIGTDAPWDPADPPRAALQIDGGGLWRVEGLDAGVLGTYVAADDASSLAVFGVSLKAANGFEVGTSVAGDQSKNGVIPGTRVDAGGTERWYVTTIDADLRRHIAVLEREGDAWRLPSRAFADLIPKGEGGNVTGAWSPVVVADGDGWRMYYAALDAGGVARIRTATSADGLNFTPEEGVVVPVDADWASAAQVPHAVEALADGRLRLWYTGDNGGRSRIGAADGAGSSFTLAPGANTSWQLGTGDPGEFDDAGVADPLVVVGDDGVVHLWYAGFDGSTWRIGYATRGASGAWTRQLDPVTKDAAPALPAFGGGFAAGGVFSPTLVPTPDGLRIAFAGYDGTDLATQLTPRVGLARPRPTASGAAGTLGTLFPEARFPTSGDTLTLTSGRGAEGTSPISLEQTIETISNLGVGTSNLVLDDERGFLYVPSKRSNLVYVIDARDDSAGDFTDRNALDVEALLRFNFTEGPRGVRDVVPIPGTNRLLVATIAPTSLLVVDAAELLDDDRKQVLDLPVIAMLPLRSMTTDENDPNYSGSVDQIGPGDLLMHPDGRSVFVPQFLEDAGTVFDLGLGPFGVEVAHIDPLGSNPWTGAFTPDGKLLFVANLRGDTNERETSSTIAVIDADPDSPTRWQILTLLVNR